MKWAPKPAQAECKRCERLFCYFQIAARRLFCSLCVEIDRLESLEFSRTQRRKQAAVKAHRDHSIRHFAHFPDGGFILNREHTNA